MKRFPVHMLWALAMAALFGGAGCATEPPKYDYRPQRPTMVLVYDFHASPDTVFEDPRLIAQGTRDFSTASKQARRAALGQQVRERIRNKLIDGISGLGLPTQPGDPSAPAPEGALLIRGDFCTSGTDNRKTRQLIEFGKDQSVVDTDVYALGTISSERLAPLLHFSTKAESAAMPAVMGDNERPHASRAARRARAEAKAETITIESYRVQVDQLADENSGQVIANLSQYFANRGWISRDQVRAPNFSKP